MDRRLIYPPLLGRPKEGGGEGRGKARPRRFFPALAAPTLAAPTATPDGQEIVP
jgi:hypothetical protein